MTTYKPVHALCLFHCDFQITDTRHVMLNDLLLEERHSMVITERHGHKSSVPLYPWGSREHQDRNEPLTVLRPVMLHLKDWVLSIIISPAKGEKSSEELHSTRNKTAEKIKLDASQAKKSKYLNHSQVNFSPIPGGYCVMFNNNV